MIKKIRNSLSAKVFIWIAGLLVLCSLLIYCIVMIILPKSYSTIVSTQFVNEMARFAETLAGTNYEDAPKAIEQFCQNNQARVILTDGDKDILYGSIPDGSVEEGKTLTYTAAASFRDRNEEYPLTVTVFSPAGQELTSLFLRLFPMILLLIFLISFIGAILCSKIMVKPILEISRISKRMSNLDMTWECRVDRTDELGVLANSLNIMAKRLDVAMKELEEANQKLKEDMEHITELSRQRRNFFAAASHELKTPITILKGQIESMILGIGSYKDTEKVLPETLKEVENMERLVKEILAISKIEMDGMARKTERFSMSDLLSEVTESLLPLALERKIAITQNIVSDISIWGNQSLFKKALHNILNNAIQNSPVGSEVFVDLTKKKLLIQNTNAAIPIEDLPLLFTPFYRVEKSRNKATGGSGLGLYLAATILELHGLPYKIENTENGVEFFIGLNSQI